MHPLRLKLAGMWSLPSQKHEKNLSLFDRYKKRVGRYADFVKAASHVPVAVGDPSQGSSRPKSRSTNESIAKRPCTMSLKPSKTIQHQLPKGKAKAKPPPKVAACSRKFCMQMMYKCAVKTCKPLLIPTRKESWLTVISWLSDSRCNWLIDTIINCAQNSLRQQFHPPELYDTSLGLYLM